LLCIDCSVPVASIECEHECEDSNNTGPDVIRYRGDTKFSAQIEESPKWLLDGDVSGFPIKDEELLLANDTGLSPDVRSHELPSRSLVLEVRAGAAGKSRTTGREFVAMLALRLDEATRLTEERTTSK